MIFHKKVPGIKGGWKGGRGVKVKILDNLLSIFTLYIFKCINITIKQMYKLYISVLGVYILSLEWHCKQGSETAKACILFGKNSVPAVTRKSAIV